MDVLDLYAFSMVNSKRLSEEKEKLEEENNSIINDETKSDIVNNNNRLIKKNTFEMEALSYIGDYINDFYNLLDIECNEAILKELFERIKVMEVKIFEEGFGYNLIKFKEE